MQLPIPVALALEKAIATVLDLDSDTRDRLSGLDGKVIRVCIDSPQMAVDLSITQGQVFVSSSIEEEVADTTISGTVQSLLSLIRGNDAMYTGAVRIEGDIGVGQLLKDILGSLDPDWQEVVSPVLGDALTHRLDHSQARFRQWFSRTKSGFEQNSSEYLQEEVQLLAPNSEVERFCREVDDCRAALDRLNARLDILESCIDESAPKRFDGDDSC